MASATSFLNHSGSRPPLYRTPSPPRCAVEPISPFPTKEFNSSQFFDQGSPQALNTDLEYSIPNKGLHSIVDGGSRQRSCHGRSGSTIDTLATIALATSPTFNQLSYRPLSPASASATPLFGFDTTEFGEPPAKRLRSEKDPSFYQRASAGPDTSLPSIPDSMKTDAELLLNFARPNFASFSVHQKRVSTDESYRYESDVKRQRVGFGNGSNMGSGEQKSSGNSSGNDFARSRMRSQSDGSAFISRPFIQGLRPNTSSSTLPPVLPQDDDDDVKKIWTHALPDGHGIALHDENKLPHNPAPKTENVMETGNSNQEATCASCNLVRIPMDTEEQGGVTWINCDGCKRWFHIVCAGFKHDREIRTVDKFICRECRPIHGPTTFVRKSSRARTAIDYAGLNQGFVKSATDTLEHHYIEPIKQGKIQFLPENFPRMRPELITAEYFEQGNGMLEPVVIPAFLNSRLSIPIMDAELDALAQEAPSQEMFDELLDHLPDERQDFEEVTDCGQDLLDMVIPQGLTVRTVADLYGPEERVEVIDVKSQQGEDKKWNMQRWADYYESTDFKVIRNVISLEVSQSKLGKLIRRPKVVRDLDLQDSVWPEELRAIGDYPKVQFYCLMSVADSYTDFHIDFGGSWVYYHILKGKKTFFFIPPKDKHLKKYEDWCNSPAQDTTFLGDQTKECYRVDLSEGDTMLIPSGWIHAVWTPENSLVIGGNFLTRLSYEMQIKVAKIEKDTKVPRKFRYPFFQKIQWYTALKYLEEDPLPQSVLDTFAQDENYRFKREYPIYYEFGERTNMMPPGSPYHNSRFYSKAELDGLLPLAKYLLRTALIAGSYAVEGVTTEARNAVRRSIPKGIGDPVDVVRKFGIWVAWKRGNEPAPSWVHPGVIENDPKLSLSEKRPTGRPSRRSERHTDHLRMQGGRHPVSEQTSVLLNSSLNGAPSVPSSNGTSIQVEASSSNVAVKDENPKPRTVQRSSGLGPKRVACDACRKRRIRCRHKDEQNDTNSIKQISVHAFGNGMALQQQQSSLTHDAASALNSLAAIASEAGFKNADSMIGTDQLDGPGKSSTALIATPGAVVNRFNDLGPVINSGKKGRSKACDDCRKSKVRDTPGLNLVHFRSHLLIGSQRRCIHDEHGNIDPGKAQERSKPRATNSAKRPRQVDGDVMPASNKKPKQESTSPVPRPAKLGRKDGEAPIERTHTDEQTRFGGIYWEKPKANEVLSQTPVADIDSKATLGQASYASPPAFQTDNLVPDEVNPTSIPSQPVTSLVSPPTSQADETDVLMEHSDGDVVTSVERESVAALQTPTLSSRHSSRQPRNVDRYVPDSQAARPSKLVVQIPPVDRSSTATNSRKVTPTPVSASKKSSLQLSSSDAKKSSSPIVEKKSDRHGTSSISPSQPSKGAKRERSGPAENGPDAESLRLIRELQEQDFGLRKRTARA